MNRNVIMYFCGFSVGLSLGTMTFRPSIQVGATLLFCAFWSCVQFYKAGADQGKR